jgi:malate synthase
MGISLCKDVLAKEQLKDRRGIIAAITAAVAAYMEEEEKVLAPAMHQRRSVAVSRLWSSSGREEIMLMRRLWQRRIVSR